MARSNISGIYKYVTELYIKDQKLELLKELDDPYLGQIMLSPLEARIISILLKLHNTNTLLEIGTLVGYSSIFLALENPQLQITTIERNSNNVSLARANFNKYSLTNRIELIEDDAKAYLGTLPNGCFDAIFIDANKPAYPCYLTEAQRILKEGGLLIADNTLLDGEVPNPSAAHPRHKIYKALQEFNELLAERFDSIIIPTLEGLSIGIKR